MRDLVSASTEACKCRIVDIFGELLEEGDRYKNTNQYFFSYVV